MHLWGCMMCAEMKIKISVYFVKKGVWFHFKEICSMKMENKQMDTDAFDFQEIIRVGQSFYILTFLFFNLSTCHCNWNDFYHYIWQSLEIGSSYSQTFSMKIVHNTTYWSFDKLYIKYIYSNVVAPTFRNPDPFISTGIQKIFDIKVSNISISSRHSVSLLWKPIISRQERSKFIILNCL